MEQPTLLWGTHLFSAVLLTKLLGEGSFGSLIHVEKDCSQITQELRQKRQEGKARQESLRLRCRGDDHCQGVERYAGGKEWDFQE